MKTNRLWWEIYLGDAIFYFGFLNIRRGDIRLGASIGWRDTMIDLLFITFGFMR